MNFLMVFFFVCVFRLSPSHQGHSGELCPTHGPLEGPSPFAAVEWLKANAGYFSIVLMSKDGNRVFRVIPPV